MKKNTAFKFSFFVFVLILISCGRNGEKDSYEKTNKTDSVSNKNSETEKLFSHFKLNENFPLVVDTAFMKNVKAGDSLGTREVKLLVGKWFDKTSFPEPSYLLEQFYKIDSVKAAGTFAKWADSLEIGETKYSNIYSLRQLKLNEHLSILVWALTYQSYEACPYSEGTEIYYSVFSAGKISETFLLGEEMSGADAPVSMRRIINGSITKDGKIILDLWQENDQDIDLPTVNVEREHYELALVEGKTNLVLEKKETPKKIKRKK